MKRGEVESQCKHQRLIQSVQVSCFILFSDSLAVNGISICQKTAANSKRRNVVVVPRANRSCSHQWRPCVPITGITSTYAQFRVTGSRYISRYIKTITSITTSNMNVGLKRLTVIDTFFCLFCNYCCHV